MTAVFENAQIRFLYPENWTVATDSDTYPPTVTVQSPNSGFWTLVMYREDCDPDELTNQVEHAVHETEKSLDEHKDKLSDDDVKAIEDAKDELKKSAEGEDKAAIEKALQEFQAKAQKLGEVIYKEAQAKEGAEADTAPTPEPESASEKDGDEPVDADFEVKA